jgi:protein-tyrosine phosphatase
MTKILMVCLGNICRSPLAQGILESKLPSDKFYVDSAGTASYHIGSQPDRRSITVAKLHQIDISHQSARQFSVADFDRFDIIYAMDQSNYSDILSKALHQDHINKVKLIMDENPLSNTKYVPDPYYGDLDDFEAVFKLLDETCHIIARRIIE